MSLLSQHVAVLKSEEFVLGVSHGFRGEAGSRFEGIESTKIMIVSTPASQNWSGYTAIEQAVADAKVGETLKNKKFPARCYINYKRVSATETKTYEGRQTSKDVEKLIVDSIEYISQVDLVDVKVTKAA